MVRHRRRPPAGRVLAAGAVALIGLGLAGVATVILDRDDAPEPATVALDARDRAEADSRADRSARESTAPASPTAVPVPATVSPTPAATPTKAATKPRAATQRPRAAVPRATTPKPKPSWVIPMAGAQITSCYGQRGGVLHAGIDFALPAGTPIHAAAAGTVVKAGDAGDGYGISVFLDHGNGYLTHYAHQGSLKVAVGDRVGVGQVIGYEGSTGDSTGPHLHFEVHQGQMWNQIDPAPFLRARGIDVAC
ncbi:M23 family metallopeptidase [Micromonospora sp. WMMD987]|uniref:M23 family metallopeptidase n=1 Tax=Micromonospora sp. WMMD987 TaxID=3016089 RepID=UPI00249CE767|nr:M23 family metallopeptidase [Micromonospora sp. WMMD987]WFE98332.1 M23 family metallopeptidase [Micromonospora sp. WMMD987]